MVDTENVYIPRGPDIPGETTCEVNQNEVYFLSSFLFWVFSLMNF